MAYQPNLQYNTQFTMPSAPSVQQQFFPQPQGNVYSINNTLEVANVPASAGLTVALCLNEGLMYIKSIQNGSPMLWAYKLSPYVEEEKKINSNQLEDRVKNLEDKLNNLIGSKEVSF